MGFEICHDRISYLISTGCEEEKWCIRTEIFWHRFMLIAEIQST